MVKTNESRQPQQNNRVCSSPSRLFFFFFLKIYNVLNIILALVENLEEILTLAPSSFLPQVFMPPHRLYCYTQNVNATVPSFLQTSVAFLPSRPQSRQVYQAPLNSKQAKLYPVTQESAIINYSQFPGVVVNLQSVNLTRFRITFETNLRVRLRGHLQRGFTEDRRPA